MLSSVKSPVRGLHGLIPCSTGYSSTQPELSWDFWRLSANSLRKELPNCRSCYRTTPRYSVKNFEGNRQTPLGESVIQSRHQSSLPVFWVNRILTGFRIPLSKLTSSGRGTSVTPWFPHTRSGGFRAAESLPE